MKIVKVLSFLILTSVSVISINAMDADKVLMQAAQTGNIELAKHALNKGAKINQLTLAESPLSKAVSSRRLKMVEFLLDNGADPSFDYKGQNEAIRKFLARQGKPLSDYEVNLMSPLQGMTPLHHAAANGDLPIVKALIAKGAKVNARDNDDETPLDLARRFKRTSIVEYLEEAQKNQSDTNDDEDVDMMSSTFGKMGKK